MVSSSEVRAEHILRNYTDSFTLTQIYRVFCDAGLNVSMKELFSYIRNSPLVLSLDKSHYITKAGAFTNRYFSIKPTKEEWNQKMFVVGDRCIPFTDTDMVPTELTFVMDSNIPLPLAEGTFDCSQAVNMFLLYGEEYASQYIAADPANMDSDILNADFELPAKVRLSGVGIIPLIRNYGMKYGDRLLCNVVNWDRGIVSVAVVHDDSNGFDCGRTGELRLSWYEKLEKLMIRSFDKYGPCGSIEEQICNLFCRNTSQLCVSTCGSMEEFLNRYARKVGMEDFGVETRLWNKGVTVPAVGPWNSIKKTAEHSDGADGHGNQTAQNNHDNKRSLQMTPVYMVPDFILNQYVFDMFYRRSVDFEDLLNRILPKDYDISKARYKKLLLNMQERSVIIGQGYNWFADQKQGAVRSKALNLYGQISALIFKIDGPGDVLINYPQQELVILSQLYSHIGRILQAISEDEDIDEEFDALMASLEGMQWKFEEISGVLEAVLEKQKRDSFKILNGN